MRNFNWETLPKHSVEGKHNIWTADKTDGEYELDTEHMEELFSRKQGQQQVKALNRQSLRGLPNSASGGVMVSILCSKRSMNIGIFLKQLKRTVKDMIEEIKSGSSLTFGPGKLKELCKLLPDEGEKKQLVGFKGDPSALPDADLLMLMLVKIPSYEERLSSLVLKEELFPLMDEMKNFISTLTAAGNELLESEHLHSVIRLVLKTGNYMNAGGYAGSAIGFRMASLLKLADTKANKPGMNLMHYVVIQAQKSDGDLLNFADQLTHIEAASRLNKGEIEADYEKQVKRVQDTKTDTLKQEDLKAQMDDFLKGAEVCLAEMETDLQELQSVSDSVADYFCENPEKFKLEECCSIFHSFCEKFMRAMQENKAREGAEVKRRHRERLQNAVKRRSTATCSTRDKEMEGIQLQSVLQNFLTSRVSRRRLGRPSSAYGSPTSSSPNDGSLSEMNPQANLPTEIQKRIGSVKATDMGRKEWSSAVELSENPPQKKTLTNSEDNKAKGDISNEQEVNTLSKEDSRGLTQPASRTTSVSSSGRLFSTTTDDSEEDLHDNSEEEAQRLRDASKKVLRFQKSRSSVSSDSFENLKSPGPKVTLTRQRTFDEDTERYPGDPTNEDLVRLLLNPQSFTKCDLGRRHTLPSKVPQTEEEEDKLCPKPPVRSPSAAREKGTLPAEGSEQNPSNQVFDFSNLSQSFKNSGSKDQHSPSAEKKSKLNVSVAHVPDAGHEEQIKVDKSMEPSGNPLQRNSETPTDSAWTKTENSGLFFSFLKRLGDMSKLQTSKETVHKGNDSSV